MGHFKITTLNDIVDTLKLQFYKNDYTTSKELTKFNKKIDDFIQLKNEAMQIKNHDNQKRFVNTKINKTKYKVMATSQSSFNVILQNGDISIGFLKFSPGTNNPLIKVEFRAEFLLRNGYQIAINEVKKLIKVFLDNYIIKVSEIHLAKDIQGYEFSPFDIHKFKTLSKNKTVFHNDINSEYYFGNKFSGFALGKGDEMLRVYNKTLEITQKKQKAFIQVLSWNYNNNFDESRNVWRLEFQLRRARLKELLGKDGLLDTLDNVISSISSLWSYCISRFTFKFFTNQQIQEQVQGFKYLKSGQIKYLTVETLRKRFKRANIHYVWEQISSFEDKQEPKLIRVKEIKKPEVEYVKNSIKAVISTFIKLNRGDFKAKDLLEIFIETDKEVKEKHNISMIDKARVNALDYIVKANTFYNENGIVKDSLEHYKKDFKDNLHDTFALLENEPSNIFTFEQFQKRLNKVA